MLFPGVKYQLWISWFHYAKINHGKSLMQMIWLMTMFVFAAAFFLVFFAVYFFRPKKKDKIIPLTLEKEVLDPEEISLPHRAEPDWPAKIETAAGKTAEASIVSITHGSAFIASSTELPIGEKFQITILLPERPHLQLRAEVTWSNMHLPPDKVLNRGMGIRFIEAGADAVCLINDTINRHAAKLQPPANQGAE
jgi:Tfp pilus assembly protein PilZ